MNYTLELNKDLPIYQHWGEVPSGVVTLTTIEKAGKKLADGQVPVAYKQHYKGTTRYFALYDISQCVEKKTHKGTLKTADEIDSSLPVYDTWEIIPGYLRRKSEVTPGLRLAKNQPVAAYFRNQHDVYYCLYDANLFIPKKSEAQNE